MWYVYSICVGGIDSRHLSEICVVIKVELCVSTEEAAVLGHYEGVDFNLGCVRLEHALVELLQLVHSLLLDIPLQSQLLGNTAACSRGEPLQHLDGLLHNGTGVVLGRLLNGSATLKYNRE